MDRFFSAGWLGKVWFHRGALGTGAWCGIAEPGGHGCGINEGAGGGGGRGCGVGWFPNVVPGVELADGGVGTTFRPFPRGVGRLLRGTAQIFAGRMGGVLAATILFTAGGGRVRGDSLEARINALLGDPLVKGAQVGMDVVEIGSGGAAGGGGGRGAEIFSHNPELPLEPASNTKLLTTGAALERYGAGASFKTNLFQVGPDLLLVGGGDPGLGDYKIAVAAGQTPTGVFEDWADELKRAGITHYRQLIVDDRVFDRQWVNADWPAGQLLSDDYAEIGGLNFNANCLDWMPKATARGVGVDLVPETGYVTVTVRASQGKESRVSMVRPADSNHFEMRGTVAAGAAGAAGGEGYSVPVYDPGMWTGTVLHDVLARAGIQSDAEQAVRRAEASERFALGGDGVNGGGGRLLATHATPILSVIKRANTDSLNMMAECLCKRLGYDATGKPGSWENGTAAIEGFAESLGAKPEWVSLDDGSGLSHKDRAAAKVFTAVLAHVAGRADGEDFLDTLAVPREEGTLVKRFKGLSVAGHVRAKTGHIDGVSALSGIITMAPAGDAAGGGGGAAAGGRRIVFSILVNEKRGNVDPWEDSVCEAIYKWAGGK